MVLICRIHAIHNNTALRRQQKRIKMLRQRRLAGTVMSQDRNKFARLHRKIYILYRWNLSLHIAFLIVTDIMIT